MDDFGLYEYPKIIYDNSLHYKCYLMMVCIFAINKKKSHTIYK